MKLYSSFGYQTGFTHLEEIVKPQVESLVFIEKLLGGKGSLLEVGCAAGFFLHCAAQQGWNVSGVEPSADLAQYARSHFGLPVSIGFFEDYKPEKIFDLVTMFQLIEHVRLPRIALSCAHTLLEENGYLIIHTPNIESAEATIFRRDYNMLTPPTHLYYFSPRTLRRLVESEGFKVVRLRTTQVPGLLRAVLTYWFFSHGQWKTSDPKKARRASPLIEVGTSEVPVYRQMVRSVLNVIDVPLSAAIARAGIGSMIEMVCRKS